MPRTSLPAKSTSTPAAKEAVREFWDRASCGEVYAEGATLAEQLDAQANARYQLEPYIREFARFEEVAGKDVLEIGVGMGADHLELARAHPRSLVGIDLTERAAEFTRQRLSMRNFAPDVRVADAESLPFADASFDFVYSFGVLHHSPDTHKAVREVWRVLRPGGRARVMIYHKWSIVGLMLWLRYGLLAGHPFTNLDDIYASHLESPGTKAYTLSAARQMFEKFAQAEVSSQISFGDLLEGEVGQRHHGRALSIAKSLWPRRLIRRRLQRYGLMLKIDAMK